MKEKTICDRIDEIFALAHILSLLFEVVEDQSIRVNLHAVARIGKMIEFNIIRITQYFNENEFN